VAFQLPNFNITVNIWTGPNAPPFGAPRVAAAPANLAWGKRVSSMSTGGTSTAGILVSTMTLLLEATCDVRGFLSSTGSDCVEVPSGSGRYYRVWFADFIGIGSTNQHNGGVIYQQAGFKTPYT